MEYSKAYYEANKERIKEKSKAYYEANKEKRKEQMRSYREANKDKIKEIHKAYREANKEKINDSKKRYREANKDKIKAYYEANREKIFLYFNKRMKSDNFFKLKNMIRNSITRSLKKNGYTKRSRAHEILGCDYETFKAYIEKQFTKGMSWDNHGEWHLDHIYPVSLAKTEEELIKLNHYTNFQPLWASENLSKGNKIIEPIQMKLRI